MFSAQFIGSPKVLICFFNRFIGFPKGIDGFSLNLINKSIEIGLKVAVFEVDYFICWGTPDELETYNYWESCFNKWENHPYKRIKN